MLLNQPHPSTQDHTSSTIMRSITDTNVLSHMLSQPPPGIDPDVHAKICALFSQPEPNNATYRGPQDTVVPTLKNTSAQLGEVDLTQNASSMIPPTAPSQEETSCPPTTPPQPSSPTHLAPHPPMQPMIIARFDYPSESHSKETRHSAPTSAPARATWAPPLEPPSVSSLITKAIDTTSGYITSYIESFSQPAIIEYAPWEIAQRSNIQIQAQVSDSASVEGSEAERSGTMKPENMVKVMAVVSGGQKQRLVAITAKPKRIKEILRAAGYKLTEDIYEEQIHEAMKRLRG
ncbi:hypothetical protein P3342_009640 [Pyrenophora teres f. teres]|uniref:Uncharacterized protein n=1 Tax=Pyrenophora teres f. teres (strain 0-1) TaxID=861557 RepID=E3RPC3_PYRTT|nr:hypothetical protein PTT_10477 [Pyrenophora teres f. teres 0-1]KAK1908789.1 hypothetical protein P3342_009640 [Pyrenophora teres f. teres]